MQDQSTAASRRSCTEQRAEQVLHRLYWDFGVYDLAREAQLPVWKAGRALSRLAQAGEVERVRKGVWRVAREEVS